LDDPVSDTLSGLEQRLQIGERTPHMTSVTRWKSLALLAGVVTVAVTAQTPATAVPTSTAYDDTYYKDAIGKTGEPLKDALNQIISKDVSKLSYDEVWDALKKTDEDPDNSANVILLYTGRSQSKNSNGGNPDDWNREHVWAK